jgi:hypothetical protein
MNSDQREILFVSAMLLSPLVTVLLISTIKTFSS